nr:hypothetical protein Iba_chr06eCG9330 [Ipomoea batatas]
MKRGQTSESEICDVRLCVRSESDCRRAACVKPRGENCSVVDWSHLP